MRCSLPTCKHILLAALFPPHCPICQQRLQHHDALCSQCWHSLNFIAKPYCYQCGLPFPHAMGEEALCGLCIYETPAFTQARAALWYDDASQPLITQFKYADQIQLARLYAGWMLQAAGDMLPTIDVILPVPLHWRRFVWRRYNQSALLATKIGRLVDKPTLPDGLQRIKATIPQTGLSKQQRQHNVSAAFRVHPKHKDKIVGRHILLIDDVYTTGATLTACVQALKSASAKEVSVLTLARRV